MGVIDHYGLCFEENLRWQERCQQKKSTKCGTANEGIDSNFSRAVVNLHFCGGDARSKHRVKNFFERAAGRGVRDEALVGEGEDDAIAAGGITGIADARAVCREKREGDEGGSQVEDATRNRRCSSASKNFPPVFHVRLRAHVCRRR